MQEHRVEDRLDRAVITPGRDDQPQRQKWVEGVSGRKAHRDAERARTPQDEAVGPLALRGDFRRPDLAEMFQESRKQNGNIFEFDTCRKAVELFQAEIRKGRDDVKDPG